jgi:hypothetical protein
VFAKRRLDQKFHETQQKLEKKSGGKERSKGNSEGSVVKLCDCGWHTYLNSGGNEECNNSSQKNINHNIG